MAKNPNVSGLTSNFLVGQHLADAVHSVIMDGHAQLAVAFWGQNAVEILRLPVYANGVRVACDAFSGFCHPNAIRLLMERGVEVYDSPGLHAKVYWGPNIMVVGSANASTNGFGISHQGTPSGEQEAAMLCRDQTDIRNAKAWLDNVFIHAFPVTIADIPRLNEKWKAQPKPLRRAKPQKLVDILRRDPAWFADRKMYAVIYNSDTPPTDVLKSYENSVYYPGKTKTDDISWPFYWNTDEWIVEPGALILDFIRVENVVRCTGVWRVLGRLDNGNITAVEFVDNPFGMNFPKSDYNDLVFDVNQKDIFSNSKYHELLDIVLFSKRIAL